jgi:hypothetical protein
MRQYVMLSVVILSALSGCERLFTNNSFFGSRDSKAESKDPASPVILTVPADATYVLQSYDRANGTPLFSVPLRRGDRYGFRRENDQMVAVAGKQTFPIPDGMFAWVVVNEKPDPVKEVVEGTMQQVESVKKFMAPVVGVAVVVCVVAGAIVGATLGHGSLDGFNLGAGI